MKDIQKRDNMKRMMLTTVVLIAALMTGVFAINPKNTEKVREKITANPADESSVTNLTYDSFKKLVFDYEKNKEWKYEGNQPAIIDFYADWCPPCRQLSPVVEQLAKEYAGKIVVYKVDTQKEQKLAASMGIQSLPTLLFIPVEGQPQISVGALPKDMLVKAINDVLKVK
jgi:thioredoxin